MLWQGLTIRANKEIREGINRVAKACGKSLNALTRQFIQYFNEGGDVSFCYSMRMPAGKVSGDIRVFIRVREEQATAFKRLLAENPTIGNGTELIRSYWMYCISIGTIPANVIAAVCGNRESAEAVKTAVQRLEELRDGAGAVIAEELESVIAMLKEA